MEFTTVDRILAKLGRELGDSDFNEGDVIEYIGEALDFLAVAKGSLVPRLAFAIVEDYQAELPCGLAHIVGLARSNASFSSTTPCSCSDIVPPVEEEAQPCPIVTDCNGTIIGDYEVAYYRPYFDLKYEALSWVNSKYFRQNYIPIRLSNHTFFGNIVCEPKEGSPYQNSCGIDEYTIVGDLKRELRFSFKEGLVAISYLAMPCDPETGYPLVPVNISYITGITYYVKWKLAESLNWRGKAGFSALSEKMEALWLKYCRQAKNWAKMPKTIDEYQNLLEASFCAIPDHNKYYNFFGNLGRPQSTKYNDPDYRNKPYYH